MDERFNGWINSKRQMNIQEDILSYDDIIDLLHEVKALLFPGYVEEIKYQDTYFDEKIINIKRILGGLLTKVTEIENVDLDVNLITESFLNELPHAEALLKTDIDALFEGDPAAKSKNEIILCYPGLNAIFTYRVAHILYKLNVPILARAMSENAHSKNGIDIHPGAEIDEYFFIDHGTGIVVGETTIIGKHVKIYQGVTLGALSLREGQKLKNSKRHPTICDNVTIYSGASIFGGETVIGANTTIGSNAFITSSVDSDMTVTISGQKKHHNKEV